MAGAPQRHWCFTDNNRKVDWNTALKVVEHKQDQDHGCECLGATDAAADATECRVAVRYAIWQHERGDGGGAAGAGASGAGVGGTNHNQGYLELHKPCRLAFLLQHIGAGVHWEPRRGTRDEARKYCRKERQADLADGERVELGKWQAGGQGARDDLARCQELLDGGADEFDVASAEFGSWVRYHRAFERYGRMVRERRRDRRRVPTVECWLGPPGCGKSRAVAERAEAAQGLGLKVYWKNVSKWWDGYDNHDVVIIDDFKGWLQYSVFLKVLDRYPLQVENKGGSVTFDPSLILITSSAEIEHWYQFDEQRMSLAEVTRRINTIHRMN